MDQAVTVANVTSGAEAVPARPARDSGSGSGRGGVGGQEAGWKVLASTVNTGSSLAHSACGVDQYSAYA